MRIGTERAMRNAIEHRNRRMARPAWGILHTLPANAFMMPCGAYDGMNPSNRMDMGLLTGITRWVRKGRTAHRIGTTGNRFMSTGCPYQAHRNTDAEKHDRKRQRIPTCMNAGAVHA